MKKFVAALLVLTMVAALAGAAFATNIVKADKWVEFKRSAWGYGKVTNNYGKKKSDVAMAKGSGVHVVATKGDWYQIEIPARGKAGKYDLLWFNSKYTKDIEEPWKADVHYPVLFSSGGSGRSQTWIEDFDTLPKDFTKIRIKEGCRTNVRKTPSLKGKSLGVIGKGHGYTVKLAKSRKIAYDSRGVMFYAIRYKGKDAWVSSWYVDKVY